MGAHNPQEVATLEPGKPIERELAGGQKHIYQLALSQGQYANVTVEQRGVDIVVRLFATDIPRELCSALKHQGLVDSAAPTP